MSATVDRQASLKRQVKSALAEILREEPSLLREAMEDIALGRAMREGMSTKAVSRDRIFASLRRKRA